LLCAVLATRIREPRSTATRVVAGELIMAARVRVQSLQMVFAGRARKRLTAVPDHRAEPEVLPPSLEGAATLPSRRAA